MFRFRNRKFSFTLFFVLVIYLFNIFLFWMVGQGQGQTPPMPSIDYPSVIAGLNMSAIEGHIKYFSGLGSRMTGYPGGDASARYIHDFFASLPGFENVTYDFYDVVVPVSFGLYGANLTVLSPQPRTIDIYAFMPNGPAVTNTAGKLLRGPLVYVGDGDLEDFDGKPMDGSIVLMDFNSRQHWLRAANLGAKAVIFIEPSPSTTRTEGDMKYLLYAPAAYPRFYVEAEEGAWLLDQAKAGAEMEIYSNQQWLTVKGRNVMAFLPGRENPELTIILTAAFDTQGTVPMVNPGAGEAVSVSALLELARYFSQNRPKLSILFLAFSGQKRWGTGAREWVEKHFFNKWYNLETREKTAFLKTLVLGVELDVTPDTDIILPTTVGKRRSWQSSKSETTGQFKIAYFEPLVEAIEAGLSKEFKVLKWGEGQKAFIDEPVYAPVRIVEELLCAGLPSFALSTGYSWRNLLDTPLDTYQNLPSLDGLRTQLEFAYCAVSTLANDPNLRNAKYFDPKIYDVFPAAQGLGTWWELPQRGFYYIEGRIVTWNISLANYSPVGNALVFVYAYNPNIVMYSYENPMGDTRHLVVKTDDNGTFRIPGFMSTSTDWIWVRGYVVNSTGHILYAPNLGRFFIIWGFAAHAPYRYFEGSRTHVLDVGPWSVFKCSSIALFEAPGSIGSFDFESLFSPESHSAFTENLGWGYTVAVAFVPPGERVGFMANGLLINSSREYPHGYGFQLSLGEQYVVKNPLLSELRDMYLVDENRINLLRGLRVVSASQLIVQNHEKVGEDLRLALEALSAEGGYRYTTALSLIMDARDLEMDVYYSLRNDVLKTVNTVPYFAALLLPFAFLAERLFVGAKGYKRRAMALTAIYISVSAFFWWLHPGFKVALNPSMVLIGYIILFLLIPVYVIVGNRVITILRETRKAELGPHFAKTGRFSGLMESFSLGAENMRRRRLRTGLTLSSLIVMSTSLVLFTSLEPVEIRTREETPMTLLGWPPFPYKGIYVKLLSYGGCGSPGIGEPFVNWLRQRYGKEATIAPRVWLYPSIARTAGAYYLLTSRNGIREAKIEAIMGATPEEDEVRDVSVALVRGWWFEPGQRYVCLLSNATAQKLDADLGDEVSLMGIKFTVNGIYSTRFINLLYDLDQQQITPIHILATSAANLWSEVWVGQGGPIHFDPGILIPYETALSLAQRPTWVGWANFWGTIAGVSIAFKNETQISAVAEEISRIILSPGHFYASAYGSMVFATIGDKIIRFDVTVLQARLMGFSSQLVLLAMVFLICLNIMFGAVHERIREIATYSSLGLSPSQVGSMFTIESVLYGLVGCVMGYVGAMFMFNFLTPPEMNPNYTSEFVTLAVFAGILVTVSSSLYPALKASKLVTPSLERRFKIPTKPMGDEWEIPLPFIAENEEEAEAILAYLAEYTEGHLTQATVAVEVFAAERLWYTEERRGEKMYRFLNAWIHLIPFDRNVRQETHTATILGPDGKYHFTLFLRRKSGFADDWMRLNNIFVYALREQLLMWRSLKPTEREGYIKTAKERLQKIRQTNQNVR